MVPFSRCDLGLATWAEMQQIGDLPSSTASRSRLTVQGPGRIAPNGIQRKDIQRSRGKTEHQAVRKHYGR